MPIIKSAKKRVKTTRKATVRNAKTKKTLRGALKTFAKSLGSSKAGTSHNKAQSALDKAAKKGLVHKNKVARKKRQLSAAAKKAGVKVEKKAAAKKAAPAKKVVAKKPAAKKAPAKKSATKKK